MNVSMTVRRKFGMQAKEMEQEMDAALIEVEYQLSVDSCKDHDKRCAGWAHSGECVSNPGYMYNNCKAACKKCTPPFKRAAKLPSSPSIAAAITISSPITVAGVTSNLQQTASDSTNAVGSVLSKGSDAAAGIVANGQHVLGQGKEAVAAAADKAADVVSRGSQAASKASDALTDTAQKVAQTGSDLAAAAKANAAAGKNAVVNGVQAVQGQPVLNSAGKAASKQAGDSATAVAAGLSKGSDATAGANAVGQQVLSQGKEAVGAAADKAADAVSTGRQAASKASEALTDAAKDVAKTGSDVASGVRARAAAGKDAVVDGAQAVQSQPVLNSAGKVVSKEANQLLEAVKDAVNASKSITADDTLKGVERKRFNAAQFQEAAQQRDADDIADVLDVQAADAEDARADEELEQSELAAAAAAKGKNSAPLKDLAKQAAAAGLQAASDAAVNAGHVAGAVTNAVAGGKAAGKTKDAHESDLDLTHTNKAPVLDDSIEADSIAKSDDTLKSRKDATGTVLDKAQAAGKAATDAVTDRQGILQQQKDAVTSSLEHVQDTAVTSSKKITDPEQEFQLGSEDSNKQPGSRSQKLELGKGGGGSVSKQALSQTSFLSRLVSGRISRRAIVVGFILWILSVLGFFTILRLPRAQGIRRKPLLKRRNQPGRPP